MVPPVNWIPEGAVNPSKVLVGPNQKSRIPRKAVEFGESHGAPDIFVRTLPAVFES